MLRERGRRGDLRASRHVDGDTSRGSTEGVGRSIGRQADESQLEGAAYGVGASGPRRHLDHRRHARRADVAAGIVRHTRAYDRRGVRHSRQAARHARATSTEARTGTFRNEEGTRSFGYTSMVIDPADGRVPALTAAAQTRRRASDQGSFGRRSVGEGPGLLSLRPLHHARRHRIVHACRLRERRTHHPDSRLGGDQLRDGARHAGDSARRPAAHRRRPSTSSWATHARAGRATRS